MEAVLIKFTFSTFVGRTAIWLSAMVFSLSSIGFAASAPVVQNLSPIEQGISAPLRIANDADGNFYVTDMAAGGVLKYNTYGKLVTVLKTAVPPQGIAVTVDGRVIVSQNDAVAVLDPTGREISKLGQGS